MKLTPTEETAHLPSRYHKFQGAQTQFTVIRRFWYDSSIGRQRWTSTVVTDDGRSFKIHFKKIARKQATPLGAESTQQNSPT